MRYGWNLTGGAVNAHFPNEEDMIDVHQDRLGPRQAPSTAPTGQGTGRMPGFGNLLTDDQIKAIVEYVRSL